MKILHLSDIHFQKWLGGPDWNLDEEVINELERDVTRERDNVGETDVILVTGDVAFRGRQDEYNIAYDWLKHICSLAGCDPENVWVVPGNHDVDREAIAASPILNEFHAAVRSAEGNLLDTVLHHRLVVDPVGAELFHPLRAYNEFASKFGCQTTANAPAWQASLRLSDKTTLRVHGMNSAIISDKLDDDQKVVLGSMQTTLKRVEGVVHMTMAHHPPDWLIDGAEVTARLRPSGRIQLWGHKHLFEREVIEGNLVLAAGAVQPHRQENPWEPRYNFVTLTVDDPNDELIAEVSPRVWHDGDRKFRSALIDGPIHHLRLHDMEAAAPGEPEPGALPEPQMDFEDTTMTTGRRRRLLYRFSALPYQQRLDVGRSLTLVDDKAGPLSDADLFELVLGGAARTGTLAELWDEVEKRHDDPSTDNPFRDSEQ